MVDALLLSGNLLAAASLLAAEAAVLIALFDEATVMSNTEPVSRRRRIAEQLRSGRWSHE